MISNSAEETINLFMAHDTQLVFAKLVSSPSPLQTIKVPREKRALVAKTTPFGQCANFGYRGMKKQNG